MINLLPPDLKNGYHYARRNIVLRRWLVFFLLAFIGLGMISTYGLLKLQQSTVSYNKQISDSQELFKKEHFTETEAQVKDMTSSFQLVVKVLQKEVLFSELLKQITTTIPSNANLTGLTISQVSGGIDLTAITTNYQTATQVQVNLADPANKIFSKADIVNISCGGTSSTSAQYPCTVNIRALFAANNPYLFISNSSKVKSP
jgi:hypothetical protein